MIYDNFETKCHIDMIFSFWKLYVSTLQWYLNTCLQADMRLILLDQVTLFVNILGPKNIVR